MAAHDPDPVERRHIALSPAISSRLSPTVLAFAQERDFVHVERVAVWTCEHASGLALWGVESRRRHATKVDAWYDPQNQCRRTLPWALGA